MKYRMTGFLVGTLFLLKPGVAEEIRPLASTVIKDVTLISAHLDQALPNRDVLIRDGRILDIIRSGTNYPSHDKRAGWRKESRRIDGRGKFLIPGLIDSHVHLGHNPMLDPGDGQAHKTLRSLYKRQLPRSFLYHGFTTLIDLDFTPERSGWLSDTEHAPNVYHCGRGVRVAGGYGPSFVPPAIVHKVFPNMVYEAQYRADWPKQLQPADHTVDAAVKRVVKSGAICLKTYVESGFGGIFDWSVPSPSTLVALADGARENGLVFVVHANGAGDWQRAIAGGADVIAHGLWHWQGDRRTAELTAAARAAIESAAKENVAVQPTLRVVEGEKSTLDWDMALDEQMGSVLSPDIMTYLRSPEGRWSQNVLLSLYDKHNPHPEFAPSDLIDVSIRRARDSMVTFHHAGGALLFGSDTPAQDGIGNPPGLNGYLEMESWTKAGIPLATLFESVTLDNARAFNLAEDLGSIETGKQADLLLLNSNPLKSVEAYDDIAVVFINGVAVDRRILSARHLGNSSGDFESRSGRLTDPYAESPVAPRGTRQ